MTIQKIYTGRRKESVARLRMREGNGTIIINGKKFEDYITRFDHRESIKHVLKLANLEAKVNIVAKIDGGGITGQKDAIRLALAKAISEKYPDLKPVMKENGLLTRDPREKERRKYGLAKARKRYQFSKR